MKKRRKYKYIKIKLLYNKKGYKSKKRKVEGFKMSDVSWGQ